MFKYCSLYDISVNFYSTYEALKLCRPQSRLRDTFDFYSTYEALKHGGYYMSLQSNYQFLLYL